MSKILGAVQNLQIDDKDMVFVQGGRYTPSFFKEEREVLNLFVGKYQTSQIILKEIIGTDLRVILYWTKALFK